MKKVIPVPYYSQILDVTASDWKPRSCSIVSAKMVAEALGASAVPADRWIEEGLTIGARDERYGWKHPGLTALLRNHGVLAYSQEFKSVSTDPATKTVVEGPDSQRFLLRGLEKIVGSIDQGLPIMISIRKNFSEPDTHHMVVIVGYEKDEKGLLTGLYYHDPESDAPSGGKELFVPLPAFQEGWKRLALFVEK